MGKTPEKALPRVPADVRPGACVTVAKRQISIAFPRQLAVSDNLSTAIEQVLAALLGGSVHVATPPALPPAAGTAPDLPVQPAPGDAPLLRFIDDATGDDHVRIALRLGALLEGGSFTGPWNAGDNGQSHGPYQIYLVAHPEVSAAQASDPQFSVSYMLPSYEAALQRVPPDLWDSDPKLAAAQTVFYAERPAEFYPQARIDAAWPNAVIEPHLPPRTIGG